MTTNKIKKSKIVSLRRRPFLPHRPFFAPRQNEAGAILDTPKNMLNFIIIFFLFFGLKILKMTPMPNFTALFEKLSLWQLLPFDQNYDLFPNISLKKLLSPNPYNIIEKNHIFFHVFFWVIWVLKHILNKFFFYDLKKKCFFSCPDSSVKGLNTDEKQMKSMGQNWIFFLVPTHVWRGWTLMKNRWNPWGKKGHLTNAIRGNFGHLFYTFHVFQNLRKNSFLNSKQFLIIFFEKLSIFKVVICRGKIRTFGRKKCNCLIIFFFI